jgi:HK97 family phage major capsid protein
MDTKIAEINAQLKATAVRIRDIAKGAELAARELTEDERKSVSGLLNDMEKFEAAKVSRQVELDEAKSDSDFGDAVKSAISAAEAKEVNAESLKGAKSGGLDMSGAKSFGEMFVKSATYQNFISEFPNGLPESVGVKTSPVHMGGFKDLVTSSDLPGIINPDQRGLIVPSVYGKELKIKDVITVGQTTSDIVEYARLATSTNNAAPVAEAANFNDGAISGASPGPYVVATPSGTKPFSDMTFEKVTTSVRNIAHLAAATRRSLSDAGQLMTIINNFLRWGLEEEVEDQVMAGDGLGENFDGILNATGTQAQAFVTDVPTTIRKAITKARYTGRVRPTAVGLNPVDDEALDLLKDTTNRFFGNGPFGTGPSTIWGLPRLVTESIPAGTAVVADWRQAVLWDREQTSILMTEAHKDWFARNLVAVRAEMRAAFGLLRPAGFVITDLTA